MSNLANLWEVRNLMTQALRVLNDMDDSAPPEFRTYLDPIRDPLHSALKSIDRATVPDLFWPGLAARA
jgi:hypothetical protein